jgi:hypothetical protein
VLGGTREAWRARFGAPDASLSSGDTDAFGACPGATGGIAGNYEFLVSYSGDRVSLIDRQTCESTAQEAERTEGLAYLPQDSQTDPHVYHDTVGDDTFKVVSASAAASLPSSVFINCNDGSEPPGTIELTVNATGWTAMTISCST